MYKDKSGPNTSTETSDQPIYNSQLFMITLITDFTLFVAKRVTVRAIKLFGTIWTAINGTRIR